MSSDMFSMVRLRGAFFSANGAFQLRHPISPELFSVPRLGMSYLVVPYKILGFTEAHRTFFAGEFPVSLFIVDGQVDDGTRN